MFPFFFEKRFLLALQNDDALPDKKERQQLAKPKSPITYYLLPITYYLFPPRHELIPHVQADGGHIEDHLP